MLLLVAHLLRLELWRLSLELLLLELVLYFHDVEAFLLVTSLIGSNSFVPVNYESVLVNAWLQLRGSQHELKLSLRYLNHRQPVPI